MSLKMVKKTRTYLYPVVSQEADGFLDVHSFWGPHGSASKRSPHAMALTDTAIRKTKSSDNPFKMTDSSGLYLLVKHNGSKHWYMKYRIDGKEKKLAFVP